MPVSFKSSDGVTNSTTAVTVVGAPGAGVSRTVKSIIVYNRDAGSVTATLKLVSGANTRFMDKQTVTTGASFDFGKDRTYVLDATTKSLTLELAAAPGTQSDWVSSYFDQ